ncbi:MAG: secretin N-terminal domain-containing protein, partial [Verrucomicrobiaceae bacterium]
MTIFVPAPVSRAFTGLILLLGMNMTTAAQDADSTDRPARITTAPAALSDAAPSLRMLAQVETQPSAETPATGGTTPPAKPPGGPPLGPGTGGTRGGRGGRGSTGGTSTGSASGDNETFKIEGDKVSLQFPNNSITDILGIYERLTGKSLVKDSTIFEGQPISLVTPAPVEKAEAIKLIETSMLTNGYAIVASPDGKSARILPMRTREASGVQFSQGVKFYQSAADLPETETIVSYFMKLSHLDPAQAAQMLGNHVGLNVYGRITPVSAPPGLLITESATIVRQLVSISEVIDSADSAKSLVTKFVPLKYADAPTVAQIIQATLDAQAQDKEQKGINTIRGSSSVYTPRSSQSGGGSPGSGSAPSAPAEAPPVRGGGGDGGVNLTSNNAVGIKKPQAKSQVVADSRLNQILIVAEPDDYTYVMSLITEFDKPVDVPEAYERKLKNIYSVDVLSVLADLLKDTSKGTTQLPGGGTLNAGNQQLVSSNNSLVTGRSTSTNQRGGTISRSGSSTGGSSTSDTSGSTVGTSVPDQLIEAQQDNSPISVLVNKTRVIADPLANSIIVIGPKEDKD